MSGYLITWTIDIEEAESFEDAARRAYDSFCRPGSIAHVFDVSDGVTTQSIDLDDAETLAGYPMSPSESLESPHVYGYYEEN